MAISLAALGIVFVLGALIALTAIQTYNQLVRLKNRCDNAFAQIEVQLKRRYDLIPNLVEAVKGYMSHERETLEAVMVARNQALSGLERAAKDPANVQAMKSFVDGEGALTGALGRMNFVMEAYPEIKANESVASLSEELTHTENRIAFSRQSYNDVSTSFNTYRQSFPVVLFAGVFGYAHDRAMLEFSDHQAIQEAPAVSFA